ncbi:MAG TPA: class I SAM-dependent methyltransferase [Gaiellaceae bacterium]|jgi:hypothetical protein|nr:class I SAM-dependent methyltransferase [Gaiellaceae bacterium]
MSEAIANTPAAWSSRAAKPPLEAVGWTASGQTDRFDAVMKALDPKSGDTLLDFGCGLGDLADWVEDDVAYHGCDWAHAMVNRAQAAHPDRKFHHVKPGRMFDLVAVIGTFNLADNWSKALTFQTLRGLWDGCERVMAVSVYHGTDPRCIRYEPADLATFAAGEARSFTVERYRSNDLLLVMRR